MKTHALPVVVRHHAGFTLIELMMVILLAGVFLTLAMPSFNATLQRYRVSAAAAQIANALQFARAEAIRTRNSITVGQTTSTADSSCTPDAGTPTDWHCGVDVYTAAGVQPLRTISASSLHAVHVRLTTSAAVHAGAVVGNTLVYAPMGYTTCAGCASGAPGGADSFIHIWPTVNGASDDPSAASVINTVCALQGGKVRVVPSYVTAAAQCNN